jgi:DNA-3-methyladenine glycosylase I
MQRCPWCGNDPLYAAYHDNEWGVPCHDEKTLFEFLVLEAAQAGLSWITVLRKRENYRRAFADFNVEKIARFDGRDFGRLLSDAGIIRNHLKISATINNAQVVCDMHERGETLESMMWGLVDGVPQINHWRNMSEVPASTPIAAAMSKTLKKRGFRFVGPTVIYAHMQAMGLVNDHLITCYRHPDAG